MFPPRLSALLLAPSLAAASSILLSGGTIVAFNHKTEALEVIRDGSLLITDDRIAGIFRNNPTRIPGGTETVDVTGKIITPGFIDTHKHGWQTAFKTLGSNTSLAEYFNRYGEFGAAKLNYTAEDVYIGQITGIYEALHGGVTTILDHAHHTWSNATSEAGLRASIDSGARIFWAYAFHQIPEKNYEIPEQLAFYRELALRRPFEGSPTEMGVAYDTFDPANATEVNAIISLALETNASVITTHAGGRSNSPEIFAAFGILNISIPVVFSHASSLTDEGAALLREHDQYISITPESESTNGYARPVTHRTQDQAALGIDTHFTFSSDILTQARLWLQSVRRLTTSAVLETRKVPVNSPQSVVQAFLLATRHGGLALRRDDLGVISVGAKADIVVWNGNSPALLGWNDPVAAVLLHASVGDIEHVIVDGKWKKKDFKLAVDDYPEIVKRFLASAARIQGALIADTASKALPAPGTPSFQGGLPYGVANTSDTLRGPGNGYGELFLEVPRT